MEKCAIIGNYLGSGGHYGDIALDENATIQYCWWGQNNISSYYYSPHDGERNPNKINASRWLIMTFTSDGLVYKNRNNVLTVDLKYYFDNETKEIRKYDESINLPLEVTVYTNSQSITKRLENGSATFDITPASGDDAIYAKLNNQTLKLDVNSNSTTLIASDLTKYYGSGKELSVKLLDGNNDIISGEKVSITMGGNTYTSTTNKNGIATFKVKDTPSSFSVKLTYNGKNYVSSSKTIKVKVVKPTIKASKTTIRKNKQFVVTFKDANKKVIKNVKVKFKINGKTYYKTTNSKGQAKLTINLKANKKYTVKVGFKSTKTYGTTTLTTKIKVTK